MARKLNNDEKAGLYITVIFHLVVIIVLLVFQLGYSFQKENSFVLDFTKLEERERLAEQLRLTEDAQRKLEEMLAATGQVSIPTQPLRSIAVNASLRDDRGTDAEKLYEEAERLAKDLKDGQNRQDSSDEDVADPTPQKTDPGKTEPKKEVYTGPSVLSWTLDGRKASKLPIPAYRCMGGGQVTVIITVDNQGSVVGAKVQDEVSSTDGCLREFAIRAAKLSRFSASTTAPARQTGNIVYSFIAQ